MAKFKFFIYGGSALSSQASSQALHFESHLAGGKPVDCSCYRSCAHGQGLLCLQLRADEAYGSIQWKTTL